MREPLTPQWKSEEEKREAAAQLLSAEIVNKIKNKLVHKIEAGIHPIVYDNNDWVKDTGKERVPEDLKAAFFKAFMAYPAAQWLQKNYPPHMKVTLSERGGELFGLLAISWNNQPDFDEPH